MFQKYNFIEPMSKTVQSADEAVAFAHQLGTPVVLKIASPQILHKTDIGGVALNLIEEGEIRREYARILRAAKSAYPAADIEGIEVQEMVTKGVEVIIGLLDDPQFGAVIMFGLGGC